MFSKEKIFLIIDSNSLIHRAYHAIPLLKNKRGEVINAVYGFFSILIKIVKDIAPESIMAAFDLPGPTFRHKKYKEYKAKRAPTPKDLISQFFIIKEGLKFLNIPVLEKKGFEADDVIGTIANLVSNRKREKLIILSGDKDNLQLVGPTTEVCLLRKGIKNIEIYNTEKVRNDYQGLNPHQLIDLKALAGDQSDNIPGVLGIGEKTALNLINKFGNLEKIYEKIEKSSSEISPAVIEKLFKNKDKAFMSRDLAMIRTNIIFDDLNFDESQWEEFKIPKFIQFLEKMGFHSLIKRINQEEIGATKKNLSFF